MFPKIKNSITRFLLNLLVLSAIVFSLDRTSGAITRYYYFRQVAGANYRTTYSMDSTFAEILVFGSSRANHHYVPSIFEDSLNLSFYNCGRDGNFLLYNFAIFKTILKRYHPKIIILDINPHSLSKSKDEYDRLSSLLPYYKSYPVIRPIIELRGTFEKIKLLSWIYPFNSSLLTIAIGNLEYNKTRKADIKGYVPLHKQMDKDMPLLSKIDEIEYDTAKINIIKEMMVLCKINSIIFFVVISPKYQKAENNATWDILSNLSNDHNISFINFSNDSTFLNNPNLFQDKDHLNHNGALMFSKKLVSLMRTK